MSHEYQQPITDCLFTYIIFSIREKYRKNLSFGLTRISYEEKGD